MFDTSLIRGYKTADIAALNLFFDSQIYSYNVNDFDDVSKEEKLRAIVMLDPDLEFLSNCNDYDVIIHITKKVFFDNCAPDLLTAAIKKAALAYYDDILRDLFISAVDMANYEEHQSKLQGYDEYDKYQNDI